MRIEKIIATIGIVVILASGIAGLVGCSKGTPNPLSPTGTATGVVPPPASAPGTTSPNFTLPSPSPSTGSAGKSSTTLTPTSSSPEIKISSLKAGDKPAAGDIPVTVLVANFNLVDKVGQANAQGEGHINYYLDVVPPTAPKRPATAKPNEYLASAATACIWKNVPAGQHSFMAELVNNDNTPLEPPVVTGITVDVKSGRSVIVDLIAQNITFSLKDITVPAGAEVTINFTNRDQGIPHNFDLFQAGGGQKWAVFTGHSITGPSTIVYQFTAPSVPAPYKFQCDFHPLQMNGNFIVTAP